MKNVITREPIDAYPKQFIICDPCELGDMGWLHTKLGAKTIYRSPSLPLTQVLHEGEMIGAILGWFTYQGTFYYCDGELNLNQQPFSSAFYSQMCGRFLVLKKDVESLKVLSDPGALLPAVYDRQSGAVASTPKILSLKNEIEFEPTLAQQTKRNDNTIWYPFGLVPYADISRLLPNRELDLSTGKIVRGKTDYSIETKELGAAQITDKICDSVSGHIAAIHQAGPLSAHLTAGYDSRLVLAACMKAGVTPGCYTIKESTDSVDVDIARRLATLCKVEHTVVSIIQAKPHEIDTWLDRTSHCIKDAVTNLCRTVEENDNRQFTLTGSCGEVARGFYWQNTDLGLQGMDPSSLIQRMGFEPCPLLLEEAERWLLSVGEGKLSRTMILDLAYIDHRLGGWAGPSMFGHRIEKPTISPFNCAEVYRLMLALPEQYRFEQIFTADFIGNACPSLMSLPFNRAVGAKRLLHLKNELKLLLPPSLVKKLKRMLP